MAQLFDLLPVLLAVTIFSHASADNVLYVVTFVPCAPTSTCPQGNPIAFNQTFALNGTLGLNLILKVDDQVTFNLNTDVPEHPFTVCQRSTIPNYCFGVGYNDQLKPPLKTTGNTTTVKFTNGGSYYYGSLNHPGMGGAISVFPPGNIKSGSITDSRLGLGHKLSTSMLLIAISALLVAMLT